MDKEKVKSELNRRYSGQIMSPGSIIDIIVDAMELFKQEEPQQQIEQVKQIEEDKANCDQCGKNPSMHMVGEKNLCCSCYVDKGYPPADWHPDCMKRHGEINA
jgi:formylmethanofuran dehydrogenase subunit E